jgi:peptidoglycan/LPS O-acetylase OafA/YrhL
MTLREESVASSPRRVQRRTSRKGFRPDVEGLRAVAVIAVVLYHAGIPGIGGGFIGVDVFFVISGFLITGLLFREVTSTNTIRLGRFYGARARRLLPAAGAVGVITAIGAAIVLPPLQARSVFLDGIASALYVGNYRFALQGTDYLAANAPSPFQHYWSLGVEEQFYLVWPMLIIGTAWLIRRIPRFRGAAARATPYAVVLGLVAVASVTAAVLWTRTSPPLAFFSLPTRAWELAAGGLVALSIREWRRLSLLTASIAGWGGLALILLTCTQLNAGTAYPGTAALLPVLGTALIIGGGSVTGGLGPGRVLCRPAMRAIGRISYSWYLWHWPVLLLMPALLGEPAGLPARLTATVVSAGLAVITLHLVENPGRFAAALRQSAKASLAVAGAASAAAACACVLLLNVVPAPVGHGAAVPRANIVAAPPGALDPDPGLREGPQEAAVRRAFAQGRAAVAAAAGLRAVPSNLDPPLAGAPADKAAVFVNGCVRSWREVGQNECATGDLASPTTVSLIGDSHAAMWNPALQQVAEQRHWRLETLAKVTCPLQELHINSPYLGREYTECEQWRGQIMARVAGEHPRLVVLDVSRRYGADFGFVSYDPAWIDTLGRTVAQLRRTGATVLVLGPAPDPHAPAPACLSAHLDDAGACAPARSAAVDDDGIAAEQAATTGNGGHYADLTDLFCTSDRCPMIVGNTLVFRDDNHVTTEYAQLLAPVMGALADRALADG